MLRQWSMILWMCLAIAAGPTLAADGDVQVLDVGPEHRPIGADLSSLSWLAGRWRGTGLGGQAEEVWLPPAAGVMSGTFRMVKDDAVVFYEIMTLGTSAGVTAIRLKHFHPNLEGWEERAEVREFPLLRVEPDKFYFDGMTLVRRAQTMDVYLKIEDRKAGTSRIELLRYQFMGDRG